MPITEEVIKKIADNYLIGKPLVLPVRLSKV
jgi:hypothetical protein